MEKCWTQYIKVEKKHYGYCNFCGVKIELNETKYKVNGNKVCGYCPECWAWEFPDADNPNKDTPLMKPYYDCNGRPLNFIKTNFDVNEIE